MPKVASRKLTMTSRFVAMRTPSTTPTLTEDVVRRFAETFDQVVSVTFLAGLQLCVLGLIGEYLGRLFDEAKGHPLYLVDRVRPPGADDEPGAGQP